jgi:hypothetical protein
MHKTTVVLACLLLVAVGIAGCMGPSSVQTTPVSTDEQTQPAGTGGETYVTASMNEALVITSGKDRFEITALDVIRGQQANSLLKSANMFNAEPASGSEYLLVKVRKHFVSGSGSDYASSYDFQAFADGAGYSPSIAVLPKTHPGFSGVTLIPGGKAEGWITFEVPVGAEVDLAYIYLFKPAGFIRISGSTQSTASATIAKPEGILPVGKAFTYMDSQKKNDLSFVLKYVMTRKTLQFSTNTGSQTINAPSGNMFLLAYVQATHLGSRDEWYQRVQTPALTRFTLNGPSGTSAPTYISVVDGRLIAAVNLFGAYPTYSSDDIVHHTAVGEMYRESILERKESGQGFLLFTVPEGFSSQESYLGLNLGTWYGTAYWHLI